MDKELKAKWVEALRSGKYKQGRSRLKHAGRHCCLGVLCEVAGVKASSDDGNLPLGFQPIPVPVEGVLINMNDDTRNSFAEIADYIEANL